jgi:hypothetical protein
MRPRRSAARLSTILLLGLALILVKPSPAIAYHSVVAPGGLVKWMYFHRNVEGCIPPEVVTEGWYEDVNGARIPGSEFKPSLMPFRTSGYVWFYVRDDVVDGYVVAKNAVLYDCPDGSVLRLDEQTHRAKIEPKPAELPATGPWATMGIVVLAAGAFSWRQRRFAQSRHAALAQAAPRRSIGSITARR